MPTTRRVELVLATIALSFALPACSFSYSSSTGSTAAPSGGGKPIHHSSTPKASGSGTGKAIQPSKASSDDAPAPAKAASKAEEPAPAIPKGETPKGETPKPASKPTGSTTLSAKPGGAEPPPPVGDDAPNTIGVSAGSKPGPGVDNGGAPGNYTDRPKTGAGVDNNGAPGDFTDRSGEQPKPKSKTSIKYK